MSKTLYISDLDGTLMNSSRQISAYSVGVINHLIQNGMLFSYATARSYQTASVITAGISAEIPVILHNGTLVRDHLSGKLLFGNFFSLQKSREILELLRKHRISPIVYAMMKNREYFSYPVGNMSHEAAQFLTTRIGDPRNRPVSDYNALHDGDIFYFTCIDTPDKLQPVRELFSNRYTCVYSKDIYTDSWWLEIMPASVSKANAALQLKEYLGADKVVTFGDGVNDIPLFQMADACYAVANAEEELKKIATGVIAGNDEDGVAGWLLRHAE